MGMDFDSVVFYGTTSKGCLKKLSDEQRENLVDDSSFDADGITVEKFTDTAGEFLAVGVTLSVAKQFQITELNFSELKKAEALFSKLEIKAKLQHFVNVW